MSDLDDLDRTELVAPPGDNRSRSGSSHASERDDRRQAIIEASYRLIVEKGFAGFRVREAAERSGITGATLYYYFPTKEALVQAVDTYLTQLIIAQQLQWSSAASATPRAQLSAHLAGVGYLLQHDPAIFVALHELYGRSLRDSTLQAILDRGEVEWHSYLESVLEAGVQQREFRADLDPTSAAWAIMSFIQGLHLNMPAEAMAGAIRELENWLRPVLIP